MFSSSFTLSFPVFFLLFYYLTFSSPVFLLLFNDFHFPLPFSYFISPLLPSHLTVSPPFPSPRKFPLFLFSLPFSLPFYLCTITFPFFPFSSFISSFPSRPLASHMPLPFPHIPFFLFRFSSQISLYMSSTFRSLTCPSPCHFLPLLFHYVSLPSLCPLSFPLLCCSSLFPSPPSTLSSPKLLFSVPLPSHRLTFPPLSRPRLFFTFPLPAPHLSSSLPSLSPLVTA